MNEWMNKFCKCFEWVNECCEFCEWTNAVDEWIHVRINDWIKECINVVINLTKECSNDWMLGMMNEYNLVKLFSES